MFSVIIIGDLVMLTLYVDDILLIDNDDKGIYATKMYLQQHLNFHDLWSPKYFPRIEFVY